MLQAQLARAGTPKGPPLALLGTYGSSRCHCSDSPTTELHHAWLGRNSRLWALDRVLGAPRPSRITCHDLLHLSPGNAHCLTRASKDSHPLCVSGCLVIDLHLHRRPAFLLLLCNCNNTENIITETGKQALSFCQRYESMEPALVFVEYCSCLIVSPAFPMSFPTIVAGISMTSVIWPPAHEDWQAQKGPKLFTIQHTL